MVIYDPWLTGTARGLLFKDVTSQVMGLNKQAIRAQILNQMRTQKEEDQRRKSSLIFERLILLKEFQNARVIMFYASFNGEVETFTMMKRSQELGKRIALPTISFGEKQISPILVNNLEEDLEIGPYGIRQPGNTADNVLPVSDLDLLIVPGVAFDRQNNRLGRGRGYYDRFLKTVPPRTPTVGLAFDFQIVDDLPHHPYDIPVQQVITN